MDKYIQNLIGEMLNFKIKHEYHFGERCGLTFVFKKDTVFLNSELASIEINPIGIIYEENDEFYYAPLHGEDEIDEIVKEYVKKVL